MNQDKVGESGGLVAVTKSPAGPGVNTGERGVWGESEDGARGRREIE